MSYLAIYRKYRPRTFEEVSGQEPIVKTLVNQIKNDRIGHAYLFTGSRGTGKTTTARIFARAVNCVSPKNGSPCGICQICKLEDNIDILEIDGASSNRVEAIRDLKEQVKYPPVNSKYKVYIVDEVHMLTDSSYNALLKTLEEPPSNVIFILATTEPHKIPPTIMSRCMRFDFKLLATKEIANIIKSIFIKSNIKATTEAVELIARSGQGSVRDALSIADMCVGYKSQGEITYNDILELLGTSDNMVIAQTADDILKGDIGQALKTINILANSGKSMNVVAKDLTSYFRDLGVVKVCQNPNEILGLPNEMLDRLKLSVKSVDLDKITVCIDIFSSLDQDLRYGLNPRITLENAVIKASRILVDGTNGMLARINELEKVVNELKKGNIVSNNNEPEPQKKTNEDNATKKDEAEPEAIPTERQNFTSDFSQTETAQKADTENLSIPKTKGNNQDRFISDESVFGEGLEPKREEDVVFGKLITTLRENNEVLLNYQLTNFAEKTEIIDNMLRVTVFDKNTFSLLSDVQMRYKLDNYLGGYKFVPILSSPAENVSQNETIKRLMDLAGHKLDIDTD